jgi:hypothetical protein
MFLVSRECLMHGANSFNAIFFLIVYAKWDPQQLATWQASSISYWDSFTFYITLT